MNVRTTFIIFCAACVLAGAFFFLIQQRWLVIHWSFRPMTAESSEQVTKGAIVKKKCQIYSFKDEKEFSDETVILWEPDNTTQNVKHLVGHWVTYQQDEHVLNQSLSLEAVAFAAAGQTLYLTFNQPMMSKEWSTFKKWRILECLLRTIRGVELPIATVRFLVNDEAMIDDHIDFSQDIPMAGFGER
ncbi:MAG: hypothetical protein WCT20_03045 [Candidatus Babeliales bacterium]